MEMIVKPRLLTANLLILCLVLIFCACQKPGDKAKQPGKGELDKIAVPCEVAGVTTRTMSSVVKTTGTLEPFSSVQITSRLQGTVKGIAAEQGDKVKTGKILLSLDDRDYRIALKQAQADLSAAQASLNEAELIRAKNQYERIKRLREDSLSSEQELESARASYLQAKSAYDAQQARIQAAAANLERARLDLSHTEVRAPISGIISKRYVDTGELISPAAPLFELVNISTLYARIFVSEKYINELSEGKEVSIKVDALPNQTFAGVISILSPVAEAQSRTFEIAIKLHNDKQELKAGMFARVFIQMKEHQNALVVPKDAVVERQGESFCFVVKEQQAKEPAKGKQTNKDTAKDKQPDTKKQEKVEKKYTAEMRPVQVGIEDSRYIEITQGLHKGEQVIISGHFELTDGAPVRIITFK